MIRLHFKEAHSGAAFATLRDLSVLNDPANWARRQAWKWDVAETLALPSVQTKRVSWLCIRRGWKNVHLRHRA